MTNKNGRSKGEAIVDFNDPQSVEAACKLDGCEVGPIRRKKLRINLADKKEGNRGGRRHQGGAAQDGEERHEAN